MLYIWLLIRAGRIAKKCERTFPVFSGHGHCLDAGISGLAQYDGCRRIIPRYRTTSTAY